jgi:hypothetical protein
MTKTLGFERRAVRLYLLLFGLLMAGRNALAGTWYASTINGPEELTPQATIPTGGSGVTLFATGNNTGSLYEGWYAKGSWHFLPIYSGANGWAIWASASYVAGANSLFDTYYVAHLDTAGGLRLTSWSFFNGWNTQTVDPSATDSGSVSTLTVGGKLYIFYTRGSPNSLYPDALRLSIWDGSQVRPQVLDGSGGAAGRVTGRMLEPTAVALPDGSLRVYYHDDSHGTLREAYSPDGVSWISFQVLDGPGGLGGDQSIVGWFPSAIVSNGMVNVFYTDQTHAKLRIAQLQGPTSLLGFWSFGWVDNIDIGVNNAPVIHSSAMQVYYTYSGQFRAAWGTGPGAFNSLPLDGPGGIANGHVSANMEGPVTAVETNGTAPTVFYRVSGGALRNAYWQP